MIRSLALPEVWPVTQKVDPPFLVSPVQIYRNIWTPRIVYFNFVEIFEPPEQKFLIYLGPFEIFYPPLILHSTQCAKGDNLFHLKYLILQLKIHIHNTCNTLIVTQAFLISIGDSEISRYHKCIIYNYLNKHPHTVVQLHHKVVTACTLRT